MAHFARLEQSNATKVVTYVTFLDNEILLDENGIEREELGLQHILNTIPDADQYEWKQTSRNKNFRGNYAVIGGIYDENLDLFLPSKPYASWILNDTFDEWHPPLPLPNEPEQEGYYYEWNEEAYQRGDYDNVWVLKN